MPVSFGSGVSRSFVQPDIFRGDTEPQTPNLGDLWVDLSGVTPDLKQCTDLSPLTWTSVGGSGSGTYLEVLTANRNYYVRPDGSDSNDGLSDTPGGAFLTIQKALNVVTTLYRSRYYPTIHVADGTYTEDLWVQDALVSGNYNFKLVGNTSTPSNVVIVGWVGFGVAGQYVMTGFEVQGDIETYYTMGATFTYNKVWDIGFYDSLFGYVADNEFVNGSSLYYTSALVAIGNSFVRVGDGNSISGSPTYPDGFALVSYNSSCDFSGTVTGAFTGPKITVKNISISTGDPITNISGGSGVVLENGGRIEDIAGDYPTLGITVDGGGSELTTGTKGYIVCTKAGIINRWDIIADQSGSIVMDVWKAANPSIPTNANSITGTEKPTLTAAQIASDTSLTTWTTSVAVGDVFGFEIESVSTITRVTLTIGMV